MKRVPIPTVLTAALLVLILVVYWITFQVRFNEAVVKVRFGRADAASVIDGRQDGQGGLHFKLPPPIEIIRRYDMRLQHLDTLEREIKTADGNNIIVGCYALWRIQNPLEFSVRLTSEERARESIRARIEDARDVVIGRHTMPELVNLDPDLVERSHLKIQEEMLAYAGPSVLRDFGVELVQIRLRRISLPADTTAKVQEAMTQERERLATQYRTEGRSIATSIRARAEALKNTILSFAERKANEIESAGVQASTRILSQIEKEDEEFFLWLRWMEALEATLRQNSTFFIDSQTDLYRYFTDPRLPLGPTIAPAAGESP